MESKITAGQLAEQLNGIEYPCNFGEARNLAAASGLVIIWGASDDLMELEGAICDEFGCYGGGTALVDAKGLLDRDQIEDHDDDAIADFVARKPGARQIEAVWSDGADDFRWSYRTDIPHAVFEVFDGVEKWCRGIVFSLADLKA